MLNTLLANDVRQTLDHFRRSVDQMLKTFMATRRAFGGFNAVERQKL